MFCPNPECPDFTRSGSPGEYRADVTSCPECGAALSAEPPPQKTEPDPAHARTDDRGFVVVSRLNDASSIAVARAMLDEADIRHFVRNQQSFSPWGGSGGTSILGAVELAVEPDRVGEAEQLLGQVRAAVPEIVASPPEDEPDVAGSQFKATPSLARVLFFGIASALFFAAVVIGLLESERINGFWLFLGVMMGIVALDTQRRRRQAGSNDRN